MANAVVAWDLRPEYLAYTDWTAIPGITSYVFPRNGSGTDVTQFHPGQAFLSEQNLPEIMYQLHPCAEWTRFKYSPLPEPKQSSDGSPVYEQWTRPGQRRRQLLDFKILPDKISTKEGWWYHEFVRRMDPRIRQSDIIMREEFSAERMRLNDSRYINLHLNTPGYRQYRPAWKMIAWHVTAGDNKQNNLRKQSVLDSLTDAQKQANTTRGSTPGLIDPALGVSPDNRVPVPDLGLRNRGAERAAVHGNDNLATQTAQPAQVPPAPQVLPAPSAPQVPPAPSAPQVPPALPAPPAPPAPLAPLAQPVLQIPQTSPSFQQSQALFNEHFQQSQLLFSKYIQQTQQPSRPNRSYLPTAPALFRNQIQQTQQPSRPSSSYVAIAPAPMSTAAMGPSSQKLDHFDPAPAQSDTGDHASEQARDMAAMLPPPFPLKGQIHQAIQDQASRSDPSCDMVATSPPLFPLQFQNGQSIQHQPSHPNPDSQSFPYQFHNFEHVRAEVARVGAESERATAEIFSICGNFIDPYDGLPRPPPVDLSARLIESLGLGCWYLNHADRKEEEKRKFLKSMKMMKSKIMASRIANEKKKRKESTGENENFQNLQPDVETQEVRPIKRAKSVHDANLHHNNGELYHDTAYGFQQQLPVASQPAGYESVYGFQQQLPVASQPTGYQSVYGQGPIFEGPAMQGAQLPQPASIEYFDPNNGGIVYNEQTGGMMGQYPYQVMVPHHGQDYLAEPFQPTYPYYQQPIEPVASAFLPTSTAGQGAVSPQQPWMIQPEDPGENMSYGAIQAGQMLPAHSLEYPFAANVQYDSQQPGMVQPTSGAMSYGAIQADQTSQAHSLEARFTSNAQYDSQQPGMLQPTSGADCGQQIEHIMEPQQTQQHPKGSPVPQVSTPAILSDDRNRPDVTPAPLETTTTPENIPDDALNQGDVRDSDPGQTLETRLARLLEETLSQS